MTEQLLENDTERQYADISARITNLDASIEEADADLKKYRFEHPATTYLPGGVTVMHGGDAHAEELANRLKDLEQQRQRLLGPWSDLKNKVNGW